MFRIISSFVLKAINAYIQIISRVIQKFGGRFIARGGEMVTLEGPEETLRIALIEFPSLEKAKAFYNSADYAQTKKLRERGGTAKFVAIDGYPAKKWHEAAQESSKLALP